MFARGEDVIKLTCRIPISTSANNGNIGRNINIEQTGEIRSVHSHVMSLLTSTTTDKRN